MASSSASCVSSRLAIEKRYDEVAFVLAADEPDERAPAGSKLCGRRSVTTAADDCTATVDGWLVMLLDGLPVRWLAGRWLALGASRPCMVDGMSVRGQLAVSHVFGFRLHM